MDERDAEVAGRMLGMRAQLDQCHADMGAIDKLLSELELQCISAP